MLGLAHHYGTGRRGHIGLPHAVQRNLRCGSDPHRSPAGARTPDAWVKSPPLFH